MHWYRGREIIRMRAMYQIQIKVFMLENLIIINLKCHSIFGHTPFHIWNLFFWSFSTFSQKFLWWGNRKSWELQILETQTRLYNLFYKTFSRLFRQLIPSLQPHKEHPFHIWARSLIINNSCLCILSTFIIFLLVKAIFTHITKELVVKDRTKLHHFSFISSIIFLKMESMKFEFLAIRVVAKIRIIIFSYLCISSL